MTSRCTPEVRGQLLGRIAAGASLPDACAALGIPDSTVKTWLRRGRREPNTSYAEFAAAVDAVRTAIAERTPPGTYEELQAAVHEAARAGSVRAMRLWWRMLRDERRRRPRGTV